MRLVQLRDIIWEREKEEWLRQVDLQERATRALMTAVLAAGGVQDAADATKGVKLYGGAKQEQEEVPAGGGRGPSRVEEATKWFGPPLFDWSVVEARTEELRRERGL